MRVITVTQTLNGSYSITNLTTDSETASFDQKLAAPSLQVILDNDPRYALKPSYFCPSDKRANPELDQNIIHALIRDLSMDERPSWLDSVRASHDPKEHLFGAFITHSGLRLVFASHETRNLYEYILVVSSKNAPVKLTFVTMTGERYIYEELVNDKQKMQAGLFLVPFPARVYRVTELATTDPTGPRREFYFYSPGESFGITNLLVKDYR